MNYIQTKSAAFSQYEHCFFIISNQVSSFYGSYQILNKYFDLDLLSEKTVRNATKFGVFNG